MKWVDRHSLGLVGQVVAILLLALVIEFGTSTLLYEQASQFSVHEDEAHRLAEHLALSRKIVGDAAVAARPAMVAELTTERYLVRWAAALAPPVASPALVPMRRQIIGWEPRLAASDLRLGLAEQGPRGVVAGGLRLPDNSWLYFQTRQPVTNAALSARRVTLALIPALVLMVLGGVLIRRTLLPLRRLAKAADSFDGDDSILVEEAGPGEVRRVTRAFNDLQARIHRLVGERTEALAAVSHDLRTPLARLKLRADGVADPQTRAAIQQDVNEMSAMISSLLAFLGGDDEPEPPVRVDAAVLLATIADSHSDAGRAVAYLGADHGDIITRPVVLRRAVNNLIENAVRYGTRVAVTLVIDAGVATIAVEDDGPGIPPEMLARVVEPFVRLDDARSRDTLGFGLGLAIVARAAALLGGGFALANRAGGGLRAELRLPEGLVR